MEQEIPDIPEPAMLPGGSRGGVSEGGQQFQPTGTSGAAREDSALKRAAERLRRAKEEVQRLETEAMLQAKHAARITDRAVHEHPYAAIGVARGVGVLLGMMISRR